jgi:hypothetical protein
MDTPINENEDSVLRKAQEVIWRSEDRVERVLASRMILRILARRDIEAAERYLRYAELFSESEQRELMICHLQLSHAWLDAIKGNARNALESANMLLVDAQTRDDTFFVALAHATLAEIHAIMGNSAEAREHERIARNADEGYSWKIFNP